ncbi:MAG: hypothetical protein ACD_46C00057G0001, partial [uncultured bacterium]
MIKDLANELQVKYGQGYDKTSLSRMIKFAKLYSDKNIVATLSQQLSWSHITKIIAISDDLKRDFYAEMCRIEHWDVRTLRKKVDGMLYERTALSKKPHELIKQELDKLKKT